MKNLEKRLGEYRAYALKLCQDLLDSSPNPDMAIKTPEQLVDENIIKIRHTLKNGLDVGGIVPNIIPVREIRNEPYMGWVYVTSLGLYHISWRK